ncbi:endolytic transglycosylase MltG [Streptomyces albus subsp. chlorinus]|uniref:endolytic transglycosylase MltG n=1 Tax=Streptomyces albus TaxID=1888 RepID=UPI00156F4769|nr:endolytic transglycosylase MltG [Streptomyces albus]NSC20593.1 endolytic transglycosylase MltG [Streptomyces albus subsp. chlorinus]
MTEYGRGPGSPPWDPDDPLYGDQGWSGGQQPGYDGWDQQPPQGDGSGHAQYAGQQYQQQYPYDQQQYGNGNGGWDGHAHPQAAPPAPGAEQRYDPGAYADTGGYQQVGHQHGAGYTDPWGTGEYYQGEYPSGEYPTGEYVTGEYGTGEYRTGEYGTGEYPSGEYRTGEYPAAGHHTGQYPAGGYGTEYGTGEYPTGEYRTGEYRTGEYRTGEYGTGEYASGEYRTGEYPAGAYPGGEPGTGEYPAPLAQRAGHPAGTAPHPHAPPDPRPAPGTAADPETGWDPGPDQGERDFFLGRDDEGPEDGRDEDEDDDEVRGRRRGGRPGARRGRGCGVVISVALAAGVGVVGYVGYDFYQAHFAPAPDYPGRGSGEVMVDIPDGASLAEMGAVLHKAGVVKSPGAFVDAADGNGKAQRIQAGTYVLRKKMSGASAVEMMLDPASQNGIIVAEGWRATRVYEEIDKKLDVSKGTTKKVAESGDIGLPKWAHGKPEGFLFPSKYSIGKSSTPKEVLRKMVHRAEAEYAKVGLEDEAEKAGKTPEQIVTIASLIQAEAQEDHEFGKVSRVIYNRLDKDMRLGFDSTINYARGRFTLDISVADTKYPSPYNTYLHKGLPPGPISNPGHQAIEAALKPTDGDWLYFVTVKPGDTRFTDDPAEHQKNVDDFNREQRKEKENGG